MIQQPTPNHRLTVTHITLNGVMTSQELLCFEDTYQRNEYMADVEAQYTDAETGMVRRYFSEGGIFGRTVLIAEDRSAQSVVISLQVLPVGHS